MLFDGFPEGFDDFLFSLQFNNTQSALAENKVRFQALIREPLVRLYEDLTLHALAVDPLIETKKARCVSSMYNDMRYCRDTPLKTHGLIRFRVPGREEDRLALFFYLGCSEYAYGLAIFKQTTAGMATLREGILQSRAAFAREMKKLPAHGFTVTGNRYARDHYPSVSGPLNDLLNTRSYLSVECVRPIGQQVYTPALGTEVAAGFAAVGPLYLLIKDVLART